MGVNGRTWKSWTISCEFKVQNCPDLECIQRSTPGFPAEILPRSTKMKNIKILKYLLWESVKGLENHEQLVIVCTQIRSLSFPQKVVNLRFKIKS